MVVHDPLSLPEEHVDAAEQLEAPVVGLAGGLDYPLDDFGAKGLAVFQMTLPSNVPPPNLPGQINFLWRSCVADVDDDNVLEFREQYAPEIAKVKS